MKAVDCLLEGFRWLTKPGLRAYVWIPLAINVLLFGGGTWWLIAYFNTIMNRFLPTDSWLHYFRWLLWPLLAIMLLIVVFYTFSLIANIIAAPFNAYLSAAVEKMETGVTPDSDRGLLADIWITIKQECYKTVFFLVRGIPIFIISFIPAINVAAPFLWFAYAAWSAYLQNMDYPLGNHGILFNDQRKLLAGKPLDTFGFGGLATVMLTIPVLNLIAMPVIVIGATLHYCRNIK